MPTRVRRANYPLLLDVAQQATHVAAIMPMPQGK